MKLQPEFQREGVWPKAAKSYLIDSILNGRPIPIYLQRTTSVQTGRSEFAIIDGQQRIRAIKEFMNDDFPLSEVGEGSVAERSKGRKFSNLSVEMQQRLLNFDFVVQERSGYSEADIRDIFTRMNKYVVRLSKQELRHAQQQGKFKDFVERIAKWPFWRQQRVFTLRNKWFEIQIRSVLEHAWAEIEHEVVYKSGIDMRRKRLPFFGSPLS